MGELLLMNRWDGWQCRRAGVPAAGRVVLSPSWGHPPTDITELWAQGCSPTPWLSSLNPTEWQVLLFGRFRGGRGHREAGRGPAWPHWGPGSPAPASSLPYLQAVSSPLRLNAQPRALAAAAQAQGHCKSCPDAIRRGWRCLHRTPVTEGNQRPPPWT